MTRQDLAQIKPIPGFDCVKLKNEIQAKIYEETKNMTREEIREYYRKGSEEFWAEFDRRKQLEAAESDK